MDFGTALKVTTAATAILWLKFSWSNLRLGGAKWKAGKRAPEVCSACVSPSLLLSPARPAGSRCTGMPTRTRLPLRDDVSLVLLYIAPM
jgi:hypothetical protein